MLAGLIFASEEADGRPGTLAATLPFGGLTLIEFQARLLAAAGVSQIVLVVERVTPELLGAAHRITRRGAALDTVRTAAEVLEKLHPLTRVLVVADGVVTTGEIVSEIIAEPGEALLVTDEMDGPYERIGAFTAWAGLALVDRGRIEEVTRMPRDYDLQSALLRAAAQAGAVQLRLSSALPGGHRIEHDPAALAAIGDELVAASISRAVRWADRLILGPAIRAALPPLIARQTATVTVVAANAALALAGLAATLLGWPIGGLVLVLLAVLGLSIGAALAWLRDELGTARWQRGAVPAAVALAVLGVARTEVLLTGTATALAIAVAGIIAAGLVERTYRVDRARRWWSSPAASLVLLIPFVVLGWTVAGLTIVALYAAATLAAAIEAGAEKP